MKNHKYIGNCKLCNRVKALAFHHLIPVKCHTNKWFKKNFEKAEMKARGAMLCKDCHDYIHECYEQKVLGRRLNTLKLLKADNKINKFLKFVRKKK